jgi:molybdenum cofactor guanylyltransferase
MGSDKALLHLAGKPLILRAKELAREVSDNIGIVGDPPKFAGFGSAIEDVFPDCGPLGGIHAALSYSVAEWNLILAVDLPFLTARFLKYLLAQAQSSGAAVTVVFTGGHHHPLCAVYRKSFAFLAERALIERRNKIDALYKDVPVRVISEKELIESGFSPSIFRNLNTRDDWEQAQREFKVG